MLDLSFKLPRRERIVIIMGLIHIYCGDGKGKTTAALGLALRGAGSGMRVHIVQFLKGSETAELHSLALIPNITLERSPEDFGFTFSMSDEDKRKLTEIHNEMLKRAVERMAEGSADMVILDEFNAAYRCGLMDRALAREAVLQKPEPIELVLTGRDPDPVFVEAADYVSEIRLVKHPYQKGISARKGIEY